MKRNLFIFMLLTFFVACGPYIWFKVPQPKGGGNIDAFPIELTGNYFSVVDSFKITVGSNIITKEYEENIVLSKEEFRKETGDSISEDTSFTFPGDWDITVEPYGDSVKVFSKNEEELFKISDDQILREYKGYYFLNYRDSNAYWKVKILNLVDDTLEFDNILTSDDIEVIRNITKIETHQDTTEEDNDKHFLAPSKRELKKILKKRSSGDKYVKLD